MNINNIKKEFSIFDEKIHNNDLVYLDSANSSQKPKIVLDRINDFYSKQFSNVGRSVHYLSVAATNMYENTRSSVQKYINAKDKNNFDWPAFLSQADGKLMRDQSHSLVVSETGDLMYQGRKCQFLSPRGYASLDYCRTHTMCAGPCLSAGPVWTEVET